MSTADCDWGGRWRTLTLPTTWTRGQTPTRTNSSPASNRWSAISWEVQTEEVASPHRQHLLFSLDLRFLCGCQSGLPVPDVWLSGILLIYSFGFIFFRWLQPGRKKPPNAGHEGQGKYKNEKKPTDYPLSPRCNCCGFYIVVSCQRSYDLSMAYSTLFKKREAHSWRKMACRIRNKKDADGSCMVRILWAPRNHRVRRQQKRSHCQRKQ